MLAQPDTHGGIGALEYEILGYYALGNEDYEAHIRYANGRHWMIGAFYEPTEDKIHMYASDEPGDAEDPTEYFLVCTKIAWDDIPVLYQACVIRSLERWL